MDVQCFIWYNLIFIGILFHISFPWKQLFPSLIYEVLIYGKSREGYSVKWSQLSVPRSLFQYFYYWGFLWNTVILYCVISQYYDLLFPGNPSMFVTPEHQVIGANIKPLQMILSFLYFPSDGPVISSSIPTNVFIETLLVLILVCIQVARRSCESLFITAFGNSKMHIVHFVYGMFFYTSLGPLTLYQLKTVPTNHVAPVTWWTILLHHWYHILAILLFLWATKHQHRCHVILANIRHMSSSRDDHPSIYAIPRGDWFEMTTCPHYLAEVLIYCAIFLASGCTNYKWLLVIFSTTISLSLSARSTHKWYVKKFINYPQRYVMLPWIY